MTAAERLPDPVAVVGSVVVDTGARSVVVRPPDAMSGRDRRLWAEAWRRQRRSERAGWPLGLASPVFGRLPGGDQEVRSRPAEGEALVFDVPKGVRGFAALAGRPRVSAIVVVDRSTGDFVSCRFRDTELG